MSELEPAEHTEREPAEQTEQEAAPADDLTAYLGEDPFAAWPQPESGAVIEDLPEEGSSVQHVEGEIDVPEGYAVIEGSPSGHRRSVATAASSSSRRSRRSSRRGAASFSTWHRKDAGSAS